MNTEILTESFDQFSSKITPTDLALYAGAGIILWIMFKDKLSPVQTFITNLINKIPSKVNNIATSTSQSDTSLSETIKKELPGDENIFFDLVTSWKKTRDLAVRSGCEQAVKVADEMFPFLSPTLCQSKSKAQS